MEKPVPLMEAAFTVTGEVPVEVNVTDLIVDVFTVALPKFRLAALTVNCGLGAGAALAPVPVRFTVVAFPVDELLLILS